MEEAAVHRKKSHWSFLREIISYVREKKKVKVSELALKFGYSQHYFMYAIVPQIIDLTGDIKKVKVNGTWYLVAEDEEKAIKRVLEAKPVE